MFHEDDEDFATISRKKLALSQPSYIAWSVTQLPDGRWKYTWTYPAKEYRIVLYGRLLATTTQQSYIYEELVRETPPPLEIVTGQADSEINPPFITIQWKGDPTAQQYRVQELLTTWKDVMVLNEVGLPVYSVTTPRSNDGDFRSYRVLPDTTQFDFNVITPPIMPKVSVTYSGGNINIA